MSDRKIYFGKDAISFSDSGITIQGMQLKWSEFYFENAFKMNDGPYKLIVLIAAILIFIVGGYISENNSFLGSILMIISIFGTPSMLGKGELVCAKVEKYTIFVKNNRNKIEISEYEYETFKKNTLREC